jgi:hypothetical protein
MRKGGSKVLGQKRDLNVKTTKEIENVLKVQNLKRGFLLAFV